jgi:hypothetical protein
VDQLELPERDIERPGEEVEELAVGGTVHRRRRQPDIERIAGVRAFAQRPDAEDLRAGGARPGADQELGPVPHRADAAGGTGSGQVSDPPAFFGARKLTLSSMRGSSAPKPGLWKASSSL